MSTRTLWQDLYGFQLKPGTTLADVVAGNPGMDPAVDVGIQGTGAAEGKFSLPLTDHPTIKAPNTTVDTEQARGISARHDREYDVVQSTDPVEFELPLLGHAYNVSAMLALLFQSGASELTEIVGTVDPTTFSRLSCVPYENADINHLSYITRSMQPSNGGKNIDTLVKGAICTDLTLSGESGGLLQLAATLKGAKWEQVDLGTAGLGITDSLKNSFDTVVPLKYQDSTIAVYDKIGEQWVQVFAPSISLEMTNNAMFNYYNDNAAASIHLGRFGCSGSITIPYSQNVVGDNYMIDRMLAGQTFKLAWYWGQAGATADPDRDHKLNSTDFETDPIDRYKNDTTATDPKNFVSVVGNFRVADYEMVGDNEHQVECTLEAVTDEIDTAVEAFCLYDSTKLVRL